MSSSPSFQNLRQMALDWNEGQCRERFEAGRKCGAEDAAKLSAEHDEQLQADVYTAVDDVIGRAFAYISHGNDWEVFMRTVAFQICIRVVECRDAQQENDD